MVARLTTRPSTVIALVVHLMVPVREAGAQAAAPLVAVDVAQAPLGLFNAAAASAIVRAGGGRAPALTVVQGDLAVVDHLGQRMLRASSRSTLILTLPSMLPTDFSVAIDLVPKECCQPEDVAIEGTRTINQGPESARLLWRWEDFRVIGGGPTFDQRMPEDLALATPGALTNIVFSFQGDELTVYTNGRVVHTLPNRKFARGQVLHLFLGGQNDTDRAVYLAALRVSAGAWTTSVAGAPSVVPANVPATPSATVGPLTPGQTAPLTAGQTAATALVPSSRTITLSTMTATGGPVVPLAPMPASRTVTLGAITATGGPGTLPSTASPASRTIALSDVTATGPGTPVVQLPRTVIAASAAPAFPVSRIISLSGITSTGGPSSPLAPGPASRTITLSTIISTGGPSAVNSTTTPASRTIALPSVTATGSGKTP